MNTPTYAGCSQLHYQSKVWWPQVKWVLGKKVWTFEICVHPLKVKTHQVSDRYSRWYVGSEKFNDFLCLPKLHRDFCTQMKICHCTRPSECVDLLMIQFLLSNALFSQISVINWKFFFKRQNYTSTFVYNNNKKTDNEVMNAGFYSERVSKYSKQTQLWELLLTDCPLSWIDGLWWWYWNTWNVKMWAYIPTVSLYFPARLLVYVAGLTGPSALLCLCGIQSCAIVKMTLPVWTSLWRLNFLQDLDSY